jgi:hypothetical protein
MTTEQMKDVNDGDDRQVKLSDVDGSADLPAEKPGKRRGKRVMLSVLAILLLIGVAAVGGYFLLRGERIDLKANKRMEDKVASGSDIRKAAYDSISDSLNAPSPAASPTGTAINQPSDQMNHASETAEGEKVLAPVQPDIAATLAPPPEVLTTKPASEIHSGRSEQPCLSGVSAVRATPQSVRFASTNPQERAVETRAKPVREEEGGDSRRTIGPSSNRDFKSKPPNRRQSLPSFGAMLPVRLMGALYTLRAGSIARLELTRDLKGDQWRMRRGTIFIGNVVGGDFDRAYVQINGYIDPETERLVKVEGETLGDDGGAGLRGKRRRVSSAWLKALDRAAQAGVQIATGVLNSRASSVIIGADPYGTARPADEARPDGNRSFVEVPAGAAGFVMVTRLPEEDESDSLLAENNKRKNEFTDQELAELITSADPARIREALPRMNPELRQIARMALKEIEAVGK